MPLAKGEDIITKAGSNGKVEWLFVNNLHEIGGNRQREDRRTFASQEDAQEFFEEQAAKFTKMLGRSRERVRTADPHQRCPDYQDDISGSRDLKCVVFQMEWSALKTERSTPSSSPRVTGMYPRRRAAIKSSHRSHCYGRSGPPTDCQGHDLLVARGAISLS